MNIPKHLALFSLLLLFAACSPDTEPPLIRLQGPDSLTLNRGVANFQDPGVVAFDRKDLDLADQVVISGDLDTSRVGNYVRTYTVTDVAGNSASISRFIQVKHSHTTVAGEYRSSAPTEPGCQVGGGRPMITSYPGFSFYVAAMFGTLPFPIGSMWITFVEDQPYNFVVTQGTLHPCTYTITGGYGYLSDYGDSIRFDLELREISSGAASTETVYITR